MALSELYVTSSYLSEYFISKNNGLPLSGGYVYFYRDIARTVLKPVYELVQGSGNPPNYTYAALPNPMVLSGVGSFQDGAGNNIAVYYYPYVGNPDEEVLDLYYVAVYDQYMNPQFTREAWPWPFVVGTGQLMPPVPPGGPNNAVTNDIFQPAHGFTVQQLVYLSGVMTYSLSLGTTVILAETVGIVTAVPDVNHFTLTTNGYCTGFAGLTAGTVYWLSDVTAGLMTITMPTASGHIQKPVFVADSVSSGYFINYRGDVIP